nr:hypothetical protein pmam_129 [Pithovirus mammoth]
MASFVYKGLMGGSLGRNGHPIDVLKSWLQKAIRRGLKDEALYCALRLFEFAYEGGYSVLSDREKIEEKWPGRAIFSNFLNRLIVCSGEDIGIGSLGSLPMIDAFIEFLRNDSSIEGFEERIRQLISLILFLCAQPKSRLVSHSKATFYDGLNSPIFRPKIEEKIPHLREWLTEIEAYQSDLDKLKFVLSNFTSRPELFRFLAVRYALCLHFSPEKKKIPRGWPKKRNLLSPIVYEVWNLYLDCSPNNPILTTLYKWYQRENENTIYLVLATLALVLPSEANFSSMTFEESRTAEQIFPESLGEVRVAPEWAVDKHTQKGRSQGKSSVDFALEGSRIEFAWNYSPVILEEIYQMIRGSGVTLETIPRASLKSDFNLTSEQLTLILSCPRGQLRTSGHKPSVFLSFADKFAYKGPWKESNRLKLETVQARSLCFKLLGSSAIPVEIGTDSNSDFWIRTPLLATIPPENWTYETKTGKLEGGDVSIPDRKSTGILQLSKLPVEQQAEILFGEQFVYRSYLDAVFLGAGDQGPHNNLIFSQDGQIKSVLIDYEDSSGRQEITEFASVFSKSNSILRQIVQIGLEKYPSRKDDIRLHLQETLPRFLTSVKQICIELNPEISIPFEKNLQMLQSLLPLL